MVMSDSVNATFLDCLGMNSNVEASASVYTMLYRRISPHHVGQSVDGQTSKSPPGVQHRMHSKLPAYIPVQYYYQHTHLHTLHM